MVEQAMRWSLGASGSVRLMLRLDLCMPIETKTIAESAFARSAPTCWLSASSGQCSAMADGIEQLALEIASCYDALEPAGNSTAVFPDSDFVSGKADPAADPEITDREEATHAEVRDHSLLEQ